MENLIIECLSDLEKAKYAFRKLEETIDGKQDCIYPLLILDDYLQSCIKRLEGASE